MISMNAKSSSGGAGPISRPCHGCGQRGSAAAATSPADGISPSMAPVSVGPFQRSGTPSKKSTTPVSSEYSAPTTSRPSFWISCSSTSEPWRRWLAEARMLARTACWTSASVVVPQLGRQQRLHRRAHAVDDRAQVARLVVRRPRELLERRQDRAALRVAEHDHEPRAEPLGGELDAADLRRRDDVAGDADHEQVAQALVEDDLRRHARVRAAEDDGERLLACGQLAAARLARRGVSGSRTSATKRRLPSRRRSSASRAEIIEGAPQRHVSSHPTLGSTGAGKSTFR